MIITRNRTILSTLALSLALVSVSACKSEVDEKPKAKVEDAEKKPADKVDDKAAPEVKVETKDGVVHLRGKVDSAEAKAAADSIAKGIDGAKSVKNDLQVVSPGARKAVDAKDADIAKAVESRVKRESDLKKVDVRADSGVVTLTGEVPTITASAKASEVARGVNGVRSVKNELTFTR